MLTDQFNSERAARKAHFKQATSDPKDESTEKQSELSIAGRVEGSADSHDAAPIDIAKGKGKEKATECEEDEFKPLSREEFLFTKFGSRATFMKQYAFFRG
jgi:hypothetical protein